MLSLHQHHLAEAAAEVAAEVAEEVDEVLELALELQLPAEAHLQVQAEEVDQALAALNEERPGALKPHTILSEPQCAIFR